MSNGIGKLAGANAGLGISEIESGGSRIEPVTKQESLFHGDAVESAVVHVEAPESSDVTTRANNNALALRTWQPELLKTTLLKDIETGFELLCTLPPAVAVFGGARVKVGDPFYDLGKSLGRLLALSEVPPRTGGGGGAMEAVPKGYKEALSQMRTLADKLHYARAHIGELGHLPHSFKPVIDGFASQSGHSVEETQGFNVLLPFEQKVNSAIDLCARIEQFLFRKLMLYENARGLVVMPGGYGTLDELFEVWALAAAGRHHDPMVAAGCEFWKPLLETIDKVAVGERGLISRQQLRLVTLRDAPADIIDALSSRKDVRAFERDPEELRRSFIQDVKAAISALDKLPEAVTFIGGSKLAVDNPACLVAEQAAKLLTASGHHSRVGGSSAVVKAVAAGVQRADPRCQVQGFFLAGDSVGLPPKAGVQVHLHEPIVHKEMLSRKSEALVALPGDLETLAHVFSLLTQIQTEKIAKQPIVLIGKDYWEPIFDYARKTLLNGERCLIAPEDLNLVVITDDPRVVADTILARRA